ncbi:LysR family transcriptional regulator [Enterococcus phoeniculicola]|uniref:LysR family transcriptional regulator n=1 Tax=Enterococcus phoeniculicola ATCC BAA-412 TaxID=1158610 RepID=R3WC86_9ENTE|nr:LysR family transcriptional regulator [Enterococcus phoeniculicola]EOL45486.1 LysR family transcriptional regulator [Enterococcus phoeniculicola ATCC BAA-412]EOT74848.1 LysR family transcriptional regulator [Enterococcus phoeniculicola ATCC BAA-412]OJG73713.1 LysR family transcriptional regulator [Enterococcus phoeniculicola]
MNYLHLRYFKKVVETKNITQAAKELFISQPALSRAMKNLEKSLDVPLFSHQGRNIELTTYAETFYPYVLESLQALDDGLEALHLMNEETISSIELHLEVASISIPSLVRTFLEKHPDIQLTIMQHDALPDYTKPNVLSITSEKKAGLINVPILTEPVCIALPKSHVLASKPKIYLADVLSVPIIMLSKKNAFRKTIDLAAQGKGIELTIGSITDDPATLRSILHQGLGVSFFPKISWSYEESDPFVIRRIEDFPIERTVYLSSNLTEDNPLAKTIANTLKEFFVTRNSYTNE